MPKNNIKNEARIIYVRLRSTHFQTSTATIKVKVTCTCKNNSSVMEHRRASFVVHSSFLLLHHHHHLHHSAKILRRTSLSVCWSECAIYSIQLVYSTATVATQHILNVLHLEVRASTVLLSQFVRAVIFAKLIS